MALTKTVTWRIMWKPNRYFPSATIKWHLRLFAARCQFIGANLATSIDRHRNSIEVNWWIRVDFRRCSILFENKWFVLQIFRWKRIANCIRETFRWRVEAIQIDLYHQFGGTEWKREDHFRCIWESCSKIQQRPPDLRDIWFPWLLVSSATKIILNFGRSF